MQQSSQNKLFDIVWAIGFAFKTNSVPKIRIKKHKNPHKQK